MSRNLTIVFSSENWLKTMSLLKSSLSDFQEDKYKHYDNLDSVEDLKDGDMYYISLPPWDTPEEALKLTDPSVVRDVTKYIHIEETYTGKVTCIENHL